MIRSLILSFLVPFTLNAGICPAPLAKIARSLTTWKIPKDIKNFNQAEYEKSLDFYFEKRGRLLSESDSPFTPEQKLAFFDAFRPEEMRLSLGSMSKAQKKELSKLLKKVDFKAGMSKAKLSRFFIETYLLSHPTSDSIVQRWRLGEDAFIKKLVEQRFIEEFSKNGLIETTKKFGIILAETRKEKIFEHIASYFEKETKIPGYLVNKILNEGFTDKNYAAFEKLFGRSERTKSIWNHLTRSLSWGLFGFFCYQDLKEENDEKNKHKEELTNIIVDDTEEAKALANEIINEIPDDVNIKEHLLAEWLKDYIKAHDGNAPQEGTIEFKEYEELKRMFAFEAKQ